MGPKRVVFLMSDTGAGHRAAAEAIRAALDTSYPGAYTFDLVDVYRDYTPFPFNRLPELYPPWVNYAPATWGLSYRMADAPVRSQWVMAAFQRLWRAGIRRFVVEHPADVVVSVHALFSRPIMHAYRTSQVQRPPFVTVITDLVATHAFWYEPGVERCLVPTRAAYERGIRFGLSAEQLAITGPPVHPRFGNGVLPKPEARRALGLDPRCPTVLLMAGGDGMGPLFETARALDRRGLPIQLVILAGRNEALRRRLAEQPWHQPTRVLPFVRNVPDVMAAADMLVTKAGPSTLSEACVAGLPMILNGAIPGQEDGNVAHIVGHGAGVYAPGAARAAQTVATWLAEGPERLEARARAARALGQPGAVWAIATEIHEQAQRPPIPTSCGGGRGR